MGCNAETVATIAELEAAFGRARAADRTTVIAIRTSAARLDRGRRVLGGRRARGQRPRVDPRGPGGDGRRQVRAAGRLVTDVTDLTGGSIVVTGGTQGLGEATARLAAERGGRRSPSSVVTVERGERRRWRRCPTPSSSPSTSPTRDAASTGDGRRRRALRRRPRARQRRRRDRPRRHLGHDRRARRPA